MNALIDLLRKAKRKFYILKYGLKNVHPTFIATGGGRFRKTLSQVLILMLDRAV